MKDNEVVKAVKEHVESLPSDWKFVAGREVIDKEMFLEKLDNDKKFRKTIVTMVVKLSIDILARPKRRRRI